MINTMQALRKEGLVFLLVYFEDSSHTFKEREKER